MENFSASMIFQEDAILSVQPQILDTSSQIAALVDFLAAMRRKPECMA